MNDIPLDDSLERDASKPEIPVQSEHDITHRKIASQQVRLAKQRVGTLIPQASGHVPQSSSEEERTPATFAAHIVRAAKRKVDGR